MEGLEISPLNAPTLNKMKMKKRKLQSSKWVNQETRKHTMGKRKLFTPWKTLNIQMEVKLKKLKFYFMGLDTRASNSVSDIEGEVDLRVELVSTLEELEKCRKKKRQ